MKAIVIAVLGAGLAFTAAGAAAQPSNGKACFSLREFKQWKAPDANTIFIKINNDSYYRLDLQSACSLLTRPGVHINTKSTGSDYICDPLDLQMTVSDFTGPKQHCTVKTITRMTPAEVSAIPAKYKP